MIQRASAAAVRPRLERAAELYLLYCYRCRTPARSSEFAEHLRVSLSHLSRLVPKITGQSVHSYLRQRQLGRAAGMLDVTTASLAVVAGACGFGTLSTFHRAFLSHFGETPAVYRVRQASSHHGSHLPTRPRQAPVERILSFDDDLFRQIKKC